MDEVPDRRSIPGATVAAMVDRVDPSLAVQSTEAAERGFCSVYRLTVAGGRGATTTDDRSAADRRADDPTRTLYLKAAPDDRRWAVPTEARLQAVLATQTSLPVADVLGAVDDDPELPTPFFLMEGLPGAELPYERIARLEDSTLARLAREVGRHLAQLHAVPAVDSFGHVRHDGPELAGERPSGDPATLSVGEPRDRWPDYLRERVETALDRHVDSRFAELTPRLRGWFDRRIDGLSGPFEAAPGRNDHGLHNLLLDPDTGAVTGLIDWGYTLAVPPAFDVAFATYLYGGSFLAGLPDVADRRSLVRESLLAGYRERQPGRVETVRDPDPSYELLAAVRVMNDFDQMDLPDGTHETVRDRLAADVRATIDGS